VTAEVSIPLERPRLETLEETQPYRELVSRVRGLLLSEPVAHGD
jgi:hypothetical protein